jgi:ADP-ribose pyrophosphatase YjhB (NUDIX family)
MTKKLRFCPSCESPIKLKNNRLIDCQSCGFNFYINPAPTATVIIENKQGEILLVKRKVAPKKGFWDLPGGFVYYSEKIEEAAVREIKEELNINLNLADLHWLGSYVNDNYLYRNINYHTINTVFFLRLTKDFSLKTSDDVASFQFFSKEQIPWKELAFADIKTALNDYLTLSSDYSYQTY